MGKLLRRGRDGVRKGMEVALPARTNASKKELVVGKERKLRFTLDQVANALQTKKGMVTKAAKLLGTSYKNLNEYIQANPKLIEIVKECVETRIDNAEMILDEMVEEKDKAAVIFFLKTVGKNRGYIEDAKHDTGRVTVPITFIYQEAEPQPDTPAIEVTPQS